MSRWPRPHCEYCRRSDGALAGHPRVSIVIDGRLEVGDISIVIAVAAGHRQDTFDACHYIIDRVKQIAPIWKREVGPDGASWVEGRSQCRRSGDIWLV